MTVHSNYWFGTKWVPPNWAVTYKVTILVGVVLDAPDGRAAARSAPAKAKSVLRQDLAKRWGPNEFGEYGFRRELLKVEPI